jgi:hypothetical protein
VTEGSGEDLTAAPAVPRHSPPADEGPDAAYGARAGVPVPVGSGDDPRGAAANGVI